MKEFLHTIFGDYTGIQMLGYLWFFIIGYIIYGLSEVSGRDVDSPKTPRKWSYKFWFLDNWRRYLTTLLSTYIIFRFYTNLSNQPLDYFGSFTIGFLGDHISKTLKDRVGLVSANREELMKRHLENELNKDNENKN